VFGWLANPQASVEGLAQAAAAVGVAISAQGLDQRFTEAAAVFMLTVVQRSVAAGCRLNRRKKKPNTYQLLLEPALAGLA